MQFSYNSIPIYVSRRVLFQKMIHAKIESNPHQEAARPPAMTSIATDCAEFLLREEPADISNAEQTPEQPPVTPPRFYVPFLFHAPTLATRRVVMTSRTLQELKAAYDQLAAKIYQEAQAMEPLIQNYLQQFPDSRVILTSRVEPQYLLWTMAHADILKDAMRLIPHLYNKQGKIRNDEARKERYERLLDACHWMLDRIVDDKRLVRVR